MDLGPVLARVDVERAASLALDLVSIPSPTGDTRAVSERLAAELRSLGMEVSLFDEYPATPVVIGRLRGRPGGKTFILNGHLDTVPIPHPTPERKDGRVYGRGSCDMKGPIAAGVEAARAFVEAGVRLAGDLVLCAHGLHEAPGGHAEDLIAALHAGAVTGDAALVLEVGHDQLPIVGLGSGIFDVAFRRDAPVTHQLRTPPGTPHPALAASEAVLAISEYDSGLREQQVERVGSPSCFIGQVHCGDFFNRFPNESTLQGVRRYAPEMTAGEVEQELRALLQPIADRHGLLFDLTFTRVRDGFRTAEDHPLVAALRGAYLAETGRDLPLTGIQIVADAPVFEKEGGIPCLYHGLAGEGAHGDLEWLPEAELARGARVYARTAAAYLGVTA